MDSLSCPKCGCSFQVPSIFNPGEEGKHYRTCTCDFYPETMSGGSTNMDTVAAKLYQHDKLLQILMRCFPRTSAPAAPPAGPWTDLNVDLSRIPTPMKERAIKRFKVKNPAVDAIITICKYCGDSYQNSSAPGGGGIIIAGLFTCAECAEVKVKNPFAFDFVTRIFQWVYGEPEPAPPAVLPIPTPEPPPPPENKRNIVL